jgi:hypothetical protein
MPSSNSWVIIKSSSVVSKTAGVRPEMSEPLFPTSKVQLKNVTLLVWLLSKKPKGNRSTRYRSLVHSRRVPCVRHTYDPVATCPFGGTR